MPQSHQPTRAAAERLARMLIQRMDPALVNLTEAQLADLISGSTELGTQDSANACAEAHPTERTQHSGLSTQDSGLSTQDSGLRWQDELIEHKVPAGASVLDLGCGTGQLLARLMSRKQVRGQGVELDPQAVFECVARGVSVYQSNLDAGLKGFSDQSFDYIILEETLQTLHRPAELLKEMLRVGRRSIVSFPNFAYWQVRFDLAFRGRMPLTPRLPRQWYETANIHLLTIQDFLDWASANRVRIVEGHALANGVVRPLQSADNLYAEEALLVIEGRGGS